MKKVIEKIIEIRKSKKISQTDIANHLKISQAAYAKFESGGKSGDASITLDRLFKIANFLNVTVGQLLENIALKNDSNEYITNIVERETNRLKVLAFQALEEYESMQVLTKGGFFNENNPEEQAKFEDFQFYIKNFKIDMYALLTAKGFCTMTEVREYLDAVNPNKRNIYKGK